MNHEEDEEIKKIIDNLSDVTKNIPFDKEENINIFKIDEQEENYLAFYAFPLIEAVTIIIKIKRVFKFTYI